MSKISGRATVRIDGTFYDSLPGASITPGGIQNTDQAGMWEVHHSEALIPAVMSASFPAKEGVSVASFQGKSGVEVTFVTDTGQTYIMRDAFVTNVVSLPVGGGGGYFPVEFKSNPAEELIA